MINVLFLDCHMCYTQAKSGTQLPLFHRVVCMACQIEQSFLIPLELKKTNM